MAQLLAQGQPNPGIQESYNMAGQAGSMPQGMMGMGQMSGPPPSMLNTPPPPTPGMPAGPMAPGGAAQGMMQPPHRPSPFMPLQATGGIPQP